MHDAGRYSECIMHRGDDVPRFFADYFAGRRVLLIGGAGFDPRACITAEALLEAGAELKIHLVREQRPGPSQALAVAAESNLARFGDLDPSFDVTQIDIFDTDGAIVGGRRAALAVTRIDFQDYSDVVVDLSALSIGTSFPIARLLVERHAAGTQPSNLHVAVAHQPSIDSRILRTAGDRPGWVHGFSGLLGLDHDPSPAKLWMPQLAFKAKQEVGRIYDFVKPDDTCPVLPFPARDPQLADRLALEYREELLDVWDVDIRNIVYADEDDPLDVYRTILRIDDLRQPVFVSNGGSVTIVSPTGSKVTALGALMACVERDLPVAYLEAETYELLSPEDAGAEQSPPDETPTLVHLWLEGDAYPESRPMLRREV